MAKEPTAAQTARYDHGLAATSADVDILVALLKTTAAEDGEQQAMRAVGGRIDGREPDDVAGLLLAAVWQLSGLERTGKADVDILVAVLKTTAAEDGEQQAMRAVGGLIDGREPGDVAGLLLAAVWQLSGLERKTTQ